MDARMSELAKLVFFLTLNFILEWVPGCVNCSLVTALPSLHTLSLFLFYLAFFKHINIFVTYVTKLYETISILKIYF